MQILHGILISVLVSSPFLIVLIVACVFLKLLLVGRLRKIAARICQLAALIPAGDDTVASKALLAARYWHRLAWMRSRRHWSVFLTRPALGNLRVAEYNLDMAQEAACLHCISSSTS